MKKLILVTMMVFLVFSMHANAFGNSQLEIDQQAVERSKEVQRPSDKQNIDVGQINQNAQQKLKEIPFSENEQLVSASSEIVYSKDPHVFDVLKGTTWTFTFTIISTFEVTLDFEDAVEIMPDGDAVLPFYDMFGNLGVLTYIISGASSIASDAGISQPFYYAYFDDGTLSQMYYFDLINSSSATGACVFQINGTGEFSDFYSLTGVKDSAGPYGPYDIDDDGDGYSENEGDCNDNNKNIHPGAIEICGDGVDNDCDGTVDEGCGSTWTGDYTVYIQSKLTVKKVGKFEETTAGRLTLRNNGTFELDDYSTPHDMSGTFVLDAKGKSILYTPSAAGLAALKNSIVDWLESYGLYNLNFTFQKIKTSKVKIDKNTGRATGKIKLDVSGTGYGCIPGEGCDEAKFKYKATILLAD